jgi:hypothetical protein
LITKLFADDTCLFFSANSSIELPNFCKWRAKTHWILDGK